ncbi:MAG: 4Fe-4S binding protein [Pseudomonadota bacterium]
MVYIDPDVCIDCAGCIPVCPVDAIRDDIEVSQDEEHWLELNRARSAELPVVKHKLEPLISGVAPTIALDSGQ